MPRRVGLRTNDLMCRRAYETFTAFHQLPRLIAFCPSAVELPCMRLQEEKKTWGRIWEDRCRNRYLQQMYKILLGSI